MSWKKLMCLLIALCLMTLSGCSSGKLSTTGDTPVSTLPPPAVGAIPKGDDGMAWQADIPLYLPAVDGSRLIAVNKRLTLNRGQVNARTIVEALLAESGDDRVHSLGSGISLGLYGSNPVEVSAGICTVNLSASALQLSLQDLYTLCLSLAATLSRQDDITGVNLLVCDRPIGYDIAGYLPAGTVSAHPGEELTALWELMEARKVSPGEKASDKSLSATATLYYPMKDGSGVMPEQRSITFAGQTPSQLASGLLSAMSSGAQTLQGACTMPDITSMMTKAPMASEQADGTRMITLYFTGDLESSLTRMGIEPMCFMAAVVMTITTFVPGVSSVCAVTGSTTMTRMYSRNLGALSFMKGVQRRNQYTSLLQGQVTIWLPRNGLLSPVLRNVPAASAHDPAKLLWLLSQGPTDQETAAGYTASLPAGFTSADLLGSAVDGGTLVVNFSQRVMLRCREAVTNGQLSESLLCYSLVTTLCRNQSLSRVRMCFAGEMEESLGGSIYWSGDFLMNASLLQN